GRNTSRRDVAELFVVSGSDDAAATIALFVANPVPAGVAVITAAASPPNGTVTRLQCTESEPVGVQVCVPTANGAATVHVLELMATGAPPGTNASSSDVCRGSPGPALPTCAVHVNGSPTSATSPDGAHASETPASAVSSFVSATSETERYRS